MNVSYWDHITTHSRYLTVDVAHRTITPRRNAPRPGGNRAKRRRDEQEFMRMAWHEWVKGLE